MQQTVYVGKTRKQMCGELIIPNLEPLIPAIKEKYKETDAKSILKCYAFLEQAKNTFIFKAPFDINVKYTEDEGILLLDNIRLFEREDFEHTVFINTPELLQLFYGFGLCFYTESSTLMSLHKPTHHVSNTFDFPIVESTFDISSWFRQVHLAVINREKKDFIIKKDDPLMYIKFHSKHPVKLEYFYMTEELERVASSANKLQIFSPKNPLSFLYKKFNESKLKKIIMNEIKKQQ